ncbi:HIG1 domain family member 2A, mitochondrial [Diachasmimorpha longicaudata]|uniref:HIG1 domain family member 2A, mitochondrial n=1 Tax=Diachasmimorpha longicaudata TaxID=58733 RepID=UPI0030B899EC
MSEKSEPSPSPSSPASLSDLDWIQLREEMDTGHTVETIFDKFIRKIKEQPLVPAGCAVATGALCYGLWSFKEGNKRMSQYMMRTRVIAQGFTVAVAVLGTSRAFGRNSKE